MFNGKDFSGWVNVNGAENTWTLKEDGTIACTGLPIAALRTVKQYENFIFEAEWRHLKSAGNAGIFIWASPLPAVGQPFLRAVEVQVLDHGYGNTANYTTHGDVFAIHGTTIKPFEPSRGMRSFPVEHRSKPSPEWNHYRVTCIDGVLKLAVNGKEVSGGSEANWRKGYIGLEAEESPTEWRNVKIQELPGGKAKPEETAPLAPESTNLYDGLNLKNWDSSSESSWTAHDWRIKAKGDSSSLSYLKSLEGNGEFFIDIANQEKAEGNLKITLTNEQGEALTFEMPYTKVFQRFILKKQGPKIVGYSQAIKTEEQIALGVEKSFKSQEVKSIKVSIACDKPALITNPFWIKSGN